MAARSGSKKKSGSTYPSIDAGEKDRIIVELKNRVAVLENELLSKQNDATSQEAKERRRAEEALRESEERFRNIFENAATGILIADVNRGYLAVNDRFCEITGYSRDELLTMGCEQIVHPDDQASDIAEVRRLLRGEASSFIRDLRYVHASGRTVWARVNVSLMRNYDHEEPRIVAVVEDITERKRTEDALHNNEKFLNNVFNCIQDGVSVLSKDLSVIRYNPTIEKWHGKDLAGKKCYRLFHGREEPCETCPSLRAIREKTMQREVVRDLIGWKELYAYPLVNDDGEVTGTIEQVRDITEQKRAEDALKNSELKFRTLFESASSAIFIADVETGVILDCNSNAEQLVGRPGSEIIGMHQTGLHPPENAGTSRENFKRHSRRDRVTNYETSVQHKDGRRIPVILSAIPVVINRRKVMVGSFLDITERKRAEEALRESEEKFRQMAENIGEVLFSFTPDWKQTIYVSPAYERVWGRSLNDVYGNSMAWLEGVHPDDRGLPLAVVNKHIMGNISETDTVEFRVVRPDGAVRWMLARTYPALDKQGKVCRITGIVEDITERKRAEGELMTAKAEAELYLDLMGHDMNNIHQIALGYLELALSVPPEARQDELLYKPMEVLQRSAQLIQNVRKLQRLHDEIFQTGPVDVAKVLSDIQREFGAVPDKTVKLNLNGFDHYRVMANELLHDVFANLVSNAIKHTGDCADIDIGLDAVNDNDGRYCLVSVEDNGPGIPDDFKDKIFNRLLKGTSKAKGMGLGLYLVKSLVDSYGGKVWVEDRVEGDHTKGARFVVMLPAVEE